jgi:hypothetical protein
VCRGALAASENLLGDTALNMSVRSFLKHAEGDARFTIVALSRAGVVNCSIANAGQRKEEIMSLIWLLHDTLFPS